MEKTGIYSLGCWEGQGLTSRWPKPFYEIKAEFVRKGEIGSENGGKKEVGGEWVSTQGRGLSPNVESCPLRNSQWLEGQRSYKNRGF